MRIAGAVFRNRERISRNALEWRLYCVVGVLRMPRTGWTSSIVPNADDQDVYIVVDDFGRNGRAYRETDIERADLEAVIMDMLEGLCQNPVRVVGFIAA